MLTEEKKASLRKRLAEDRQRREKNPSGYTASMQDKGNGLTSHPAELSSKNFDRLMRERGVALEEAARLKKSFREYQPHQSGKVHVRHVTKPEETLNYHNGKEGSSGVFQTKHRYRNPAEARRKLALPDSNNAKHVSRTTIQPRLSSGKQHSVIEGHTAPQRRDGKSFSETRAGGGRQIVTDGGFKTGAVQQGESEQTKKRDKGISR